MKFVLPIAGVAIIGVIALTAFNYTPSSPTQLVPTANATEMIRRAFTMPDIQDGTYLVATSTMVGGPPEMQAVVDVDQEIAVSTTVDNTHIIRTVFNADGTIFQTTYNEYDPIAGALTSYTYFPDFDSFLPRPADDQFSGVGRTTGALTQEEWEEMQYEQLYGSSRIIAYMNGNPDDFLREFQFVQEPTIDGEEMIDGIDAYRVSVGYTQTDRETYFFAKDDQRLLRLEAVSPLLCDGCDENDPFTVNLSSPQIESGSVMATAEWLAQWGKTDAEVNDL